MNYLFKMRSLIVLGFLAVCSAKVVPRDPEYGDLLEGDIMTVGNDRVACADCTKWTGNTVVYTIDNNADYTSSQLADIQAGIDDLVAGVNEGAAGCLSIVERTSESNYVRVGKYGGCSSYLGMIGGVQTMSLEDGCVNRHGTIMHEFLHAIGMHHEHKRSDRDDWVTIVEDNIESGKEHNFDKLFPSEEDQLGASYDYESVMHYSRTAFTVNGEDTIVPIDSGAEIGQRTHLSETDKAKARAWLGC